VILQRPKLRAITEIAAAAGSALEPERDRRAARHPSAFGRLALRQTLTKRAT